LKIPQGLLEEARMTFYILSLSVPVVICSANLKGILESAQRFDLVNAVKIPSNTAVFLIPALGVFFGFRLHSIIFFIILSWLCTTFAYLLLCYRVYPLLKKRIFTIDIKLFRPLFTFGGWVTVCNLLIPALIALDRFFIGALVSVASVGYYTAPYEITFRLQIFPASFALTLFPVFTAVAASNREHLEQLYAYSLKYLLLVMGPVVLIIVFFAETILQLWLGIDFAMKTSLVFQILALGTLLNALAQMPAFLLDSIGRPDLRAKIFLLYVGLYVGLLWLLVLKLGIVGAALAWAIRAGLELLLFFGFTQKAMSFRWKLLEENGILKSAAVYGMVLSIGLLLIVVLGKTFLVQSVITLGGVTLFLFYMWRWALENGEKKTIFTTIKSLLRLV